MILHLTTCNVAVGLFHHYFCLIVLGNGKIKRGKKTFETMKTKGRKKQKLEQKLFTASPKHTSHSFESAVDVQEDTSSSFGSPGSPPSDNEQSLQPVLFEMNAFLMTIASYLQINRSLMKSNQVLLVLL